MELRRSLLTRFTVVQVEVVARARAHFLHEQNLESLGVTLSMYMLLTILVTWKTGKSIVLDPVA
jgi:hypothetical protein